MRERFTFHRRARTAESESYYLYDSGNLGILDVHFGETVYVNLTLIKELGEDDLDILFNVIEDEILGIIDVSASNVIYEIYQGKEIGWYSSDGHIVHGPAQKSDVKEVTSILEKVIGRHQDAKGQLQEFAVREYFKKKGYKAEIASRTLDHLKIDLIAEDLETLIYIQSKLGQVNSRKIEKVVKSISEFNSESKKKKIIAIVAKKFPPDSEFLRSRLEQQFGLQIWFIHGYQIFSALPEFRRTIGSDTE